MTNRENGAHNPEEMSEDERTLRTIIDKYRNERGFELTIVNPSKQETAGFGVGDSVVVERSDKTIEADWKILGFAQSGSDVFAICLKADGTYKALEPSFLKDIKQREGNKNEATQRDYTTVENVVERYGIQILREPETREEFNRVAQAKGLLVDGVLKDWEVTFWTGIIQNGGQETPPYKPKLQTKAQRQKL